MLTLAQAEAVLCAYPAIRERYLRCAYPWPAGKGEPGVNVQSNVISDPTARAAMRGGAADGEAIRTMGEYQRCFARMTLVELAAIEGRLWQNEKWPQVAAKLGTTERRARLALERAERRFARLWRMRTTETRESPRASAGG